MRTSNSGWTTPPHSSPETEYSLVFNRPLIHISDAPRPLASHLRCVIQFPHCGNSSVGRASASQAECRGFETRFPLSQKPRKPSWDPGFLYFWETPLRRRHPARKLSQESRADLRGRRSRQYHLLNFRGYDRRAESPVPGLHALPASVSAETIQERRRTGPGNEEPPR